MRVVSLVVLFFVLCGLTAGGWAMASSGTGLSNDLSQNASLRAGSVVGGRVLVGGGIHSGK
jgi:hypothetical protein